MDNVRTAARRPNDPVLLAALEYEVATLEALRALDGTDSEEQVEACLRFVAALRQPMLRRLRNVTAALPTLCNADASPISPGCAFTPRWNCSPQTSTRRSLIDARSGRHGPGSGNAEAMAAGTDTR